MAPAPARWSPLSPARMAPSTSPSSPGNAAQDEASKALALAFNLDVIIVRDVDTSNPASARSLSGYALSLGKTTFVAEAGRAGMVEPDAVAALVSGSQNVLASLKMTSG